MIQSAKEYNYDDEYTEINTFSSKKWPNAIKHENKKDSQLVFANSGIKEVIKQFERRISARISNRDDSQVHLLFDIFYLFPHFQFMRK